MDRTTHVARGYQQDLDELTNALLAMGDNSAALAREAVTALKERDVERARRVMQQDDRIDADELRCDELCVRLMARWAPVGADLRLVMTALKAVTDLERIGDLAVNVAKRAIEVGEEMPPVAEVEALADHVLAELDHALAALRTRDSSQARAVRGEDRTADELNRAAFARFIQLAQDDASLFEPMLAWTSICRHLERIGDHAVNIAESVVYLVEGKVVRHREV